MDSTIEYLRNELSEYCRGRSCYSCVLITTGWKENPRRRTCPTFATIDEGEIWRAINLIDGVNGGSTVSNEKYSVNKKDFFDIFS